MLSIPIRVEVDKKLDKLDPMSRIHYGKIYTIEHNVKVKPLGMVNGDSLTALLAQFQTVLLKRIRLPSAPSLMAQADALDAGPSTSRARVMPVVPGLEHGTVPTLNQRQWQAMTIHSAALAARQTLPRVRASPAQSGAPIAGGSGHSSGSNDGSDEDGNSNSDNSHREVGDNDDHDDGSDDDRANDAGSRNEQSALGGGGHHSSIGQQLGGDSDEQGEDHGTSDEEDESDRGDDSDNEEDSDSESGSDA